MDQSLTLLKSKRVVTRELMENQISLLYDEKSLIDELTRLEKRNKEGTMKIDRKVPKLNEQQFSSR